MRAVERSRASVTRTVRPCDVNLMAFASRFQTTCCIRFASHDARLAAGSSIASSRTALASADGRTTSIAALITSANSHGRICSCSLPETMRDTSSTSSMSSACALQFRLAVGFEVVHSLPVPETSEQIVLFRAPLIGSHAAEMLPHRFNGGVAEHSLGGAVPGRDGRRPWWGRLSCWSRPHRHMRCCPPPG